MRRRWILCCAGAIVLSLVIAGVGLAWFLMRPADPGGASAQVFVVPVGAGFADVAARLEREGFIKSRTAFILWARAVGYSRSIKAGEYSFSPGMPPGKILEHLRRGMIVTHSVTIPEGVGLREMGGILEELELVDKDAFISFCSDPKTAAAYGIDAPGLEGFLFPDTYRFSKGLPIRVIVDVMVKRFFEKVDPLRERIEETGMSLKQVVTLASIIEKETGSPPERPMIASVFLNRIDKRMRLQSDPTAVYDIADFEGVITRKELKRRSPYNTYVVPGLPPGPICNPGVDSVRAVLEPAQTDFLYFVSKNDGTHHFSKTLEEHNAAVQKYRKRSSGRVS
ncbi:MAG TPA: endolytic transglycosylase MltG [Desulfobacteraceae bacterium]|nr:endolytic transglycosylase MltG [Desulfobacteraceae bacterium]